MSEGARTERASARQAAVSAGLASALRRAIPFLGRGNVTIEAGETRVAELVGVIAELGTPFHTTPFGIEPAGSTGTILLDAACAALFLDGVLGGAGATMPTLSGRLTAPQIALLSRLGSSVLTAWSDVLRGAAGLELSASGIEASPEAIALVTAFRITSDNHVGTVVFATSLDAWPATKEAPKVVEPNDPRVEGVLQEAEIELIAELGHITMSLADLSALRVGSVIMANAGLGGVVQVQSQGHPLLVGEPTTSRGRIAIRIRDPH